MNRLALPARLGLLGLLCWVPSAWAAPPPRQPIPAADHYRHELDAPRASELWNYLMQLEDGTILGVSFLISNIGLFSGTAQVSLGWTTDRADTTLSFDDDSVTPADYREDRAAGRFALGRHAVTRQPDGQLLLRLDGPDFQAELRIRPWMAGFQLGDGRTLFPGRPDWWHRVLVEVPRGDVEGSVTLRGQSHPVRGAAYVDHVIQTLPATDFSFRWATLRAFYPDHTIMAVEFYLLPELGGGRRGFGFVTDRQQVLGAASASGYRLLPAPQPRFTDPRGYSVPERFALELPLDGGGAVRGTFRNAGLLKRTALLETMSFVQRQVVSWFAGNPIIYRFRSDAELALVVDQQVTPLRGWVYHELAVLKQ